MNKRVPKTPVKKSTGGVGTGGMRKGGAGRGPAVCAQVPGGDAARRHGARAPGHVGRTRDNGYGAHQRQGG